MPDRLSFSDVLSKMQHTLIAHALSSSGPSPKTQEPKGYETFTPRAPPNMYAPRSSSPNSSDRRFSSPNSSSSWKAMIAALRGLEKDADGFPPLKAVVGKLATRLDLTKDFTVNQEGYTKLADEFKDMASTLAPYLSKLVASDEGSVSISRITKAVNEELDEIDKIDRPVERAKFGRVDVHKAKNDQVHILKRYRKISSLLRSILSDVRLPTYGEIGKLREATDSDATLIRMLMSVDDARYNSEYSKAVKRRGCTASTREQILYDLRTWVKDPDGSKVFWMNGMAGTGKTTILYSFCEWLEDNKRLAGNFFCSRTSAVCRDLNNVVSSIAHQLAQYSPAFCSQLCKILEEKQNPHLLNDVGEQFKWVVAMPLENSKDAIPEGAVIVIDALDECGDISATALFLKVLMSYATRLPIKFLVASRPDSAIQKNMQTSSMLRLHDVEQSLVEADVKLYLQEALKTMSPVPSPDVIDQLARQSGKLFFYAATVARYINPEDAIVNSEKRLTTILEKSSSSDNLQYLEELDNFYRIILSSAFDRIRLDEKELRIATLVLRTVICAIEPMRTSTMSTILDIPQEDVDNALSRLQSVLHVQAGPSDSLVTILHPSFSDFLCDEARSHEFYCDIVEHNTKLARSRSANSEDVQHLNYALEVVHSVQSEVQVLSQNHLEEDQAPMGPIPDPYVTVRWLVAKGALEHVDCVQYEVESLLLSQGLNRGDYALCAGYDRSLIDDGNGYMEQVHVFTSVDVSRIRPIFPDLARLFWPFSSMVITPSTQVRLPIMQIDGTEWRFDQFVIHYFRNNPEVLEEGGANGQDHGQKSHSDKERDKGKEKQNDEGDRKRRDQDEGGDGRPGSGGGGDGLPGSGGGGDGKEPGPAGAMDGGDAHRVSFEVDSTICCNNEKLTQTLEPVQTINSQGSISVQITKEEADSRTYIIDFTGLIYTSRHIAQDVSFDHEYLQITVDSRRDNGRLKYTRPSSTTGPDDVKITDLSKSTQKYDLSLKVSANPTVTVGTSRGSEKGQNVERVESVSRITRGKSLGTIWWGYLLNDQLIRKQGLEMLKENTKLPFVELTYRFPSAGTSSSQQEHGKPASSTFWTEHARPSSREEPIDVKFASFWALKGTPSSAKKIFKSFMKKGPSYSNMVQCITLTIPPTWSSQESTHISKVDVTNGIAPANAEQAGSSGLPDVSQMPEEVAEKSGEVGIGISTKSALDRHAAAEASRFTVLHVEAGKPSTKQVPSTECPLTDITNSASDIADHKSGIEDHV